MERKHKSAFVKWFFIIRPFTLSASFAPVLVGLATAFAESGKLCWTTAAITILCALCLQILSNLINDYCDFKKGSDDENRLGPSRAISKGEVTPRAMLLAIGIVVALVALSGLYLILVGGLPIILIGVSAMLFAWLYSATSHSLSHLGIADLFSLSYYGFIASAGTTFLQTGAWSRTALLLGLGCGAIATGILTVNNIRDIEQDRAHGKKTIIVRLGKGFGKGYYLVCLLIPVVLSFALLEIWAAAIVAIAGVLLYRRFLQSEGRAYNKILMLTGFFDLFYAIMVLVAIL